MAIKFAEIEGIETEVAEQLQANTALVNAISNEIETGVTNRVQVAKDDFKQKMDALNAKLLAAEEKAANAPDIDADELEALKQARDKNPELQATLDAMKATSETAKQEADKLKKQLLELKRTHLVSSAIAGYNVAFPTVKVKEDMHDVVAMLASDSLRYDENDDKFKVHGKDGDILATDKGAATPVDWLNLLRNERPSLFNVPAGSGAPGSKQPNGSAKKYSEMSEAERVALFKSDRDEFNRLKGAD